MNVDAIVFWHAHDAEKAALAITDYRQAMGQVAQTSLREIIGSSVLATLLSDRKQADEQLKTEIGAKTAPWGISVSAVEIRDVAIPAARQDAMSRQAQAEREKQARVILGSAEAASASAQRGVVHHSRTVQNVFTVRLPRDVVAASDRSPS